MGSFLRPNGSRGLFSCIPIGHGILEVRVLKNNTGKHNTPARNVGHWFTPGSRKAESTCEVA